MFLKDIKNKKGFTMIELMTSISIMVVISTIVMVNFNSIGEKGKLKMTAQKIASDIKKTQGYALDYKVDSAGRGAWGIAFSRRQIPMFWKYYNDRYHIFYDENGDGRFDISEIRETIFFDDDIRISNIGTHFYSFWPLPGSNNYVDPADYIGVLFTPPDPRINICEWSLKFMPCPLFLEDTARITISDGEGNEEHINVNAFGLVEVEN